MISGEDRHTTEIFCVAKLAFIAGVNLVAAEAEVIVTPYSDIPEGCVLVGPRNSQFLIFSDRLLTISHAMYLVSNKVASN